MSTSPLASLPLRRKSRSSHVRLLHQILEKQFHFGSLHIETPEGERWRFSGTEPGPHAHWQIHDWAVIPRIIRDGDIGFGESYYQGLWDSDDPAALLALALQNRSAIEAWIQGSWWRRRLFWLLDQFRANSEKGSRRNIAEHYDLGNDFYRLWLDPSMSYSSAYFGASEVLDLQSAQESKYDRALARLQLQPGAKILEIGCGWGGFAEYATRKGYVVHGITLSQEQLRYAQNRLSEAGLERLGTLEYCDYRQVKGHYDGIVSIEMFEAVGREWWSTYFRRINSLLKTGGRALIQTIHIRDELYAQYCRGSDFIRRHVFPGGFLPSPQAMRDELEQAQLEVLEHKEFGQDYARTLRAWRRTFDSQSGELAALGYDQQFQRLWRFYLAYCEAGFTEASIGVGQWTLRHA